MAGPLIGMLGKIGGTVFGSQVGQALGGLAGEVLTASDIGLPLGPAGQAALVTTNVTAFADGLDVSEEDVVLYLALRECAHQRLFAQVPWLRQHLIAAVEDYGRGMSIDTSSIEEKLQGFDATNPQAIQEALQGGMFEPEDTPQQKAALERLETTLALVEGWVDEVVGQAGDPDARPRQAPGGGTPPPRRRRPRGADVRRAGRPRAAAAPAARRLHALGLAPLPAGCRRPRRGVGAPRPAADGRRPRRPARVPRARRGARRDERRGLRRPALRPAGRGVRRHRRQSRSDARRAARRRPRRARTLGRAVAGAGRTARVVRRAPPCAPRRALQGLLPRPPDRERAGGLRRPQPGAAHAAPQGGAVVPVRRPPRAGRRHPGRRRDARGHRGVRGGRARARGRLRRTSTCTPYRSATRAAVSGTSTSATSRRAPDGAEHAVSAESYDVRWWPVDALPTEEQGIRDLVGSRSAEG